jgi:hypothetical protein
MSSRFLCPCGVRLEKNLFSGHQLAVLVREEHFDRDLSQISGEVMTNQLLPISRIVSICPSCSRLHVIDDNGIVETYLPESKALADS